MNLQAPIYITGINDQRQFLLGGIYRMKSQVGFPLDMSYETCRENGMVIDYLELLADAWLDNPLQYDAVMAELRLLLPDGEAIEIERRFKFMGALSGLTPDGFCQQVLATKKGQV